ncbi:amidase signature enzyme [Fusarium albosuccineum]|uniref:Amidase signature enzyme n=1 Tax=Fusarium albosuccineum TaxID=1237068 RepID=A0A8H4PFP7_9HYPO|nr:amidase signature enzyme [Fusarium albosuccineum]
MRLQPVLAFARAADASTVLQLNGTTYFSPGFDVGSVGVGDSSATEVLPVTYLGELPASVSDLNKQFDQLLNGDDVFSDSFMSTVIFPDDSQVSDEVKEHFKSTGTEMFVSTSGETLPS